MDHRLRVDDDCDPLVGHPEQQVRLDHLESLIDEGGRIRGDELAHVPGRMRQRLLRGNSGELLPASSAKRAAAGSQDEPADLVRAPAAQALGQRGMF